ncbi:UDP-galactopyranose mutase [Neocallimastix lanati (nom. inval.)]|nr:UDP-galactopyranose mutase [Neocallimastix sp. JGI-2020a]
MEQKVNLKSKFRVNSSKLKHYDYLIVGSGLYGSTFNYLAKKKGKSTLIVEKRDVVGGNLYCEKVEGIYVHKYGPHIFHTDNIRVWNFVNNITHFNPYMLQTMSRAGDKLYSLPFNMYTFNQLWGVSTPKEAKARINKDKYTGVVHNLEEQALSLVGRDIYEKLIKGYTEKQWGRDCKNLPSFIIKRLPTRFTFNGNYFNDRYQGIPEGCYNAMIDKLLEDTEVITGVDYNTNREMYEKIADKIVYTGKIDEYFGYKYGKLQYRTVRWDTEILEVANYQGTAVINQPDKNVEYTRIIEHKHFEPYNERIHQLNKTVISKEYSEEWDETKEGYYPINDEKNNNLYKKYKELADKEKNVIFGGRLAEYKYYDMKDIIDSVFKYWDKY